MRRRAASRAGALALGVGLAALLTACQDEPTSAPPPRFRNLVVVMIDTLRSDHLPSYGYSRDTAPFLTALAEEGVQVQGLAASSWTRPSVATLLTGLHPQRHQAIARSDALPADVPYLPQHLQELGFQTAAYLSNGNVSTELGFARGFDLVEEYGKTAKPGAEVVTDGGLRLADQLSAPFFLYLHYLDPHDPYVPARPWGEPEPVPLIQPQDVLSGRVPFDASSLRRLRDAYDAEIREMDPEIERLVRGLEQRGLLHDTLVVITSDHGEAFGEHGKIVHGHTLHREEVAVPFLLWSRPALLRPYRSDTVFHHVDFAATVLAALGADRGLAGDGVSRWEELGGGQPLPDSPHLLHLDLDRLGELAIQREEYKLIHRKGRPTNLLYHLPTDPLERQASTRDQHAEARRRLLRQLIHRHNELSDAGSTRQVEAIEGELRDQLMALGYLRPETSDERLAERVIPPRLHVFDSRPFGLFGDEQAAELSPALAPADGQPTQWLNGWLAADQTGRWASPRASVVLPKRHPGDHIVLRGRSPLDNRLTVTVNGSPAGSWELDAGPFAVTVPLPESLNRRFPFLYVDLEVDESVRAPGVPEPVGLFVHELRLGSVASPPADPP